MRQRRWKKTCPKNCERKATWSRAGRRELSRGAEMQRQINFARLRFAPLNPGRRKCFRKVCFWRGDLDFWMTLPRVELGFQIVVARRGILCVSMFLGLLTRNRRTESSARMELVAREIDLEHRPFFSHPPLNERRSIHCAPVASPEVSD